MKLSSQIVSDYTYNLSVGNPEFLQEYWTLPIKNQLIANTIIHPVTMKSMGYDFSPGRPELISKIKELHYREHGLLDIEDRYVVIGNGATQIIYALMMAYRQLREYKTVQAGTGPFFPVFKSMADSLGLAMKNDNTEYPNQLLLHTCPNNPDGSMNYSDKECILDLSYYWKTYFRSNDIIDNRLLNNDKASLVFSFSKAFGLSSTRIGWVITKNKELAELVSDFIELTSGQVAYETQQRAMSVLEIELTSRPSHSIFKYGQDILESRWKIIESNPRITNNNTVLSSRGMFLFLRDLGADTQYQLQSKGITGDNFGVHSTDLRFNIGCSSEKFKSIFIDR